MLRPGVRVVADGAGLAVTTWRGTSIVRGGQVVAAWQEMEESVKRGCDLGALAARAGRVGRGGETVGLLRHLAGLDGLVPPTGQGWSERAADLVDMLGRDLPGQRGRVRAAPVRIECGAGLEEWAAPTARALRSAGLRVGGDDGHRLLLTRLPLAPVSGRTTVAVQADGRWFLARVGPGDEPRLAATVTPPPPGGRPAPAVPALVMACLVHLVTAELGGLPFDGVLVVDGATSRRVLPPVLPADLDAGPEPDAAAETGPGRDDVAALAVLTSPASVTRWWPWSPAPGRLPQGPLASSRCRGHVGVGRDQAAAGVGAFLDAVRSARTAPDGTVRAVGIGLRDALADLVAQVAILGADARADPSPFGGILRPRHRRAVEQLPAPAGVVLETCRTAGAPVTVVRLRHRGDRFYGCAPSTGAAAAEAVEAAWAAELSRRTGSPPAERDPLARARAAADNEELLRGVTGATARPDILRSVCDALGLPAGELEVAEVGEPVGGAPVVVLRARLP